MAEGKLRSILHLQCVDRLGIVAAVTQKLADHHCNIEEAGQFNDQQSGQFFMRVVFSARTPEELQNFKSEFATVAQSFAMSYGVYDENARTRVMILVSKSDHCLNDILYRWRTGYLPVEIAGVISNHEASRELTEAHGLAFHYLPIDKADKHQQENRIAELVEKTDSELIILARYMQVFTAEMCARFSGRVINIHHSFLPGFKGAKPYHQAWERGVKIIGATAHFVTSDLDDGPIIEQDTVRIDHADDPEKLQIIGRDTEARVLSKAIQAYAERRIFLHGNRTVIL